MRIASYASLGMAMNAIRLKCASHHVDRSQVLVNNEPHVSMCEYAFVRVSEHERARLCMHGSK